MKMFRSVAALVMALTLNGLLGACAAKPTVWQKSNVQVDEQRAALAQCQAHAIRQADRDYQRQHADTVGTGYGGQTTYQKNMDAYQVGKSREDLLARCMKLKGYRQVPATN
ncbi:MAG: hypothetical protein ISR53_04760 [Rhodospirillales bacterium]|nr:hypothetical protein [Rhodospirillales bacterium]MBL6941448.1 hypothetical protein [Rhodospirillales bacterium]